MALVCSECGASDVVAGSVFCHRCGARIVPPDDFMNPPGSGKLSPPPGSESIVDQPRDADEKGTRKFSLKEEASTAPTHNVSVPSGRKQEPERDIWTVQYSPRGMIGSWILVGIIAAACLIVASMGWIGWTWMLLTIFGVALVQQCRYWYKRFSLRYRLTSYRLMQESGLINRTVNRTELIDIEDIQLVRSLIDRMVGIGSIVLLSHDVSHPKMRIDAIDNVEKRYDELEQVVRAEKRRRELRIEQG